MLTRRNFLQQTALAAGSMLLSRSAMGAWGESEDVRKLTILHTNDTHSRLEPFPMDGGKNQGLGGVAARADLIHRIRGEANQTGMAGKSEDDILLLDAGDIFQGTPYFNIYKGEPEIKAMTALGYDAATMGNHDFDAGMENFATQLRHAKFPILVCNYDFTATPLEFKTQPYQIFKKGKMKIGVTGVGINPEGLIPGELAGNMKYLNPVQQLNQTANYLRRRKGCNMVICLSHLGFSYKDAPHKICDLILARETENVDLIIGGHTHTFLDAPIVEKNRVGGDVIINQVGWAGILLGRLDFDFTRSGGKNLTQASAITIGKKISE